MSDVKKNRSKDIKKIMDAIDPGELSELAVKLGNIPSPCGFEKDVGEFICQWLKEAGFIAFKQQVVEDRFNVVGILRGKGSGKSLIFNSHMDTGRWTPLDYWGVGELKPYYNRAWLSEGRIYGEGVVNDKGHMAAFMVACKAIKESGTKLQGDLIQTMVVGETGLAAIDEFQGNRYLGKGLGTKFLIDGGVIADFSLVAESSNFAMTWAEAGCAFFKITLTGRRVYVPYLERPVEIKMNPNAIVKMTKVIEAIETWAVDYEQKNRYEFSGGVLVPKINIGAIRGGVPCKPMSSPAICSLYVDVRLNPKQEPLSVEKELKRLIDDLGIESEIQMYLYKRGYEGKNIGPLKEAIERAHQDIFHEKPKPIKSPETSMWRDINVFNEAGIPSITYGSGSGSGKGTQFLTVEDLYKASKIYALVSLYICGISKR